MDNEKELQMLDALMKRLERLEWLIFKFFLMVAGFMLTLIINLLNKVLEL